MDRPGGAVPVVWNPPEPITSYTQWKLDSLPGRLCPSCGYDLRTSPRPLPGVRGGANGYGKITTTGDETVGSHAATAGIPVDTTSYGLHSGSMYGEWATQLGGRREGRSPPMPAASLT
jgi:hypothetical protein